MLLKFISKKNTSKIGRLFAYQEIKIIYLKLYSKQKNEKNIHHYNCNYFINYFGSI
jgi:hypothetical protein